MTHSSALPLAWISCLLLGACGPQVLLDTDDDSTGTTAPEPPSTSTTVPPMNTVGPTTLPPADTGPMDTGPLDTTDTDEPWLDLPRWCSTIEQDCPPGYKCMPWANDGGSAWNSAKCVPIAADPNAPGEPCTVEGSGVSGIDDCDGTSMCWDVDPKTLEGTCYPFCMGDDLEPTCEDQCDYCTISGDGVITICLPGCDPVAQDCDAGSGCYPVRDNFVCAPDASPKGSGIASPCEFINVCPPGTVCLAADVVPGCEGGVGCCGPVCPVGGVDPCPGLLPGTECTPWYQEGDGPPQACFAALPGVCVDPSAVQ